MTGYDTALISRLCHDLISPVGAIVNGVDLVTCLGAPATEDDMALIGGSASMAQARITLFRLAFGSGGDGAMDGAALASMLEAAIGRPRVTQRMLVTGPLRPEAARIVALGMMCLDKSLPRGGLLIAQACEGGVTVRAEAERVALPDDAIAHLGDVTRIPTDPARIEFHRLATLVGPVEVIREESGVAITLPLPATAPA